MFLGHSQILSRSCEFGSGFALFPGLPRYCKRSRTGAGKGLGTRLYAHCALFSEVYQKSTVGQTLGSWETITSAEAVVFLPHVWQVLSWGWSEDWSWCYKKDAPCKGAQCWPSPGLCLSQHGHDRPCPSQGGDWVLSNNTLGSYHLKVYKPSLVALDKK